MMTRTGRQMAEQQKGRGVKTGSGWTMVALAFALGLSSPSLASVKDGVTKWRNGDYAGAVAQWKGPAAAGNADALFNLGQAYKLGRGVPVDTDKAIEYYRKAVAKGHEAAEANLGWVLFQKGNREEAVPLLEKAAARGDPHSQYLLGVAHFNGDVVKRDWVRAYALMTQAASSGLRQAKNALAEMDARVPLADRQKAMATLASTDKTPTAVSTSTPAPIPPQPAAKGDAADAAVAASAPAATPGGPQWRVQLGAYSNRDAAASAWEKISGKVAALRGVKPDYMASGTVVRLQTEPLDSKAAAGKLCSAVTGAGSGCFPVRR